MKMRGNIKGMRVKKKMGVYKNCMLLVIGTMGIISAILSVLMYSQVREITQVWSPSMEKVQELDVITSDYRMRQYGHLVATSEEEIATYEKKLEETEAQLSKASAEFEKMVTLDEEKKLVEETRAAWEDYKLHSEEVIKASREQRTEEAGKLMIGEAYDAFQDFNACFDKLLALEKREITIASDSARIMFYIMLVVIAAAIGIGVVIATKLSGILTNLITEPIDQITRAAERMQEGDMSARELITYESEDELGIVAEAMRRTMAALGEYIEEISGTLREIAKGDLTKDGDVITDFKGDFAEIKESFVYILKRFNSTLTDIQETSNQVAVSSGAIAQASTALSEGATDQASAIEELTATVETVAGLAEESAKKTQEAYENVRRSADEAEHGRAKMEELIEEMHRITEISKEIENIITSIEDIASQTNLLSLNASIEAARAGEAGRGFAVVADQIGKLASDSADSAVNTRELIGKTLEEIEKGNVITVTTSEAFEKVIEDMKTFAGVAQNTTETAKSQALALEQIEGGIEQIATVMQNTAASSEESTAVSEDLANEASALNELVQRFKLY